MYGKPCWTKKRSSCAFHFLYVVSGRSALLLWPVTWMDSHFVLFSAAWLLNNESRIAPRAVPEYNERHPRRTCALRQWRTLPPVIEAGAIRHWWWYDTKRQSQTCSGTESMTRLKRCLRLTNINDIHIQKCVFQSIISNRRSNSNCRSLRKHSSANRPWIQRGRQSERTKTQRRRKEKRVETYESL